MDWNGKFLLQPIRKGFLKNQVAPSEIDDYFRHQEIQAYVHDMGAAMLGGISGHAGLFSNAEDLAKLNQCFLNRGNYGGREIFSSGAIAKYTDRDSVLQRRGLIFFYPIEHIQNLHQTICTNIDTEQKFMTSSINQ